MLITFTLYISIVIFIGGMAYKYTRNVSDYVLAGRSLTGAMTALGAGAADMSGWLVLALPGLVYVIGASAIWMPIGLVMGAYLNWRFVAKRLRVYTEVANDALTIPSYLHQRFQDHSRILCVVVAIVILIFFTVYTASCFAAVSTIMQAAFNLDYTTGLSIGVVIIISYTMLGGFLALSWIDLFQGSMMLLALLILPAIAMMGDLPSWNLPVNYLHIMHGIGGISILSWFTWGLGYCGQPHILVRFMAIKDPNQITNARRIGMIWMVLALAGAVACGLVGAILLPTELPNSETVIIILAKQLLPGWLSGLLIAAALSAVMSTAAALLIACASAVSEDLCGSKKHGMLISRASVMVIALLAYVIAYDPQSTILDIVEYAWSGLGAAFGPVILFSLYWRRMTRNGAIAGMIAGGLMVIVWRSWVYDVLAINAILPGFICSALAIIIVSKLDKRPQAKVMELFTATEVRLQDGN